MKRYYGLLISLALLASCQNIELENKEIKELSIVVLGTVQDAGSPHIGCDKKCCEGLFERPDPKRKVTSLGIVDPESQRTYLFEASPDLPAQIEHLNRLAKKESNQMPSGIFLTHAHIGHYSGLMYLGKEALGAQACKVFVMDRMDSFLRNNGPWNQLITLGNIELFKIKENKEVNLSQFKVKPLLVPHRDEYSETVGFLIEGPNKKILFLPDIDKWEKWETDIISLIEEVDFAFIDATFYDQGEIPNRNMEEIPHPFVVESMALLEGLSLENKAKVHFIHLNHSNPLLNKGSEAYKNVKSKGFNVAEYGDIHEL